MSIPLIYIDESGFSEDMPRTFGYAPEGRRCFGAHNWQAKQRTNAIGALTGDSLLTLALFDSSINTDVFEAWIRQELLPALPNGAVVVMDNASFHKPEKIQELIENAGCLLEYLPSYSPDLNPIEHKWAQAKALRRKLGCSTDELFQQSVL
jgi:transposase